MRVEATVPESRGAALIELAKELGLTKSQVIDEALALFLKVVLEVRNGRRLVTMNATGETTCEIATPTLTQLEWMLSRTPLNLGPEAVERMVELLRDPPEASEALREAISKAT